MSGALTTPNKKIGPLVRLKLIQDAANGLTAEEMGTKYGINPAAALLAVREQLQARDVWTALEQQQLVIHDLIRLKNKISERFEEGDSKDGTLFLNTLTKLSDVLEKQSQINESDLTKVSEAHGRALLALVIAAFGRAKQYLTEEYPDVPIDEIESVFQQALVDESRQG